MRTTKQPKVRKRPSNRRKMRLMTHAERVDALCGQFAFTRTSSDEFIARKAAEIEKEDRHCPACQAGRPSFAGKHLERKARNAGAEMSTVKQRKARKTPSTKQATATRRKTGLLTLDERLRAIQGKYAWIPFSSDDFNAEKHREIEEEERRWRS